MASEFNVHNAAGYEQLMGRWSQRLARLFIDFAGVADSERVLDVGCGTGSLTFTLAKAADLAEIAAVDYSPVFVQEVIRRNTNPRITIRQADACDLPFQDSTFDRAFALLVLHFVPEAAKAVAEMCRVVRSGGVVAAAVWDHLGGMPGMRMMVDTVAALGESGRQLRSRYCFQPMMQPGELRRTFAEQGLVDITEKELMIRMDYQSLPTIGRRLPLAKGRSASMWQRSTLRSERAPTLPCAMPTRPAGQMDRGRLQTSRGPAVASFPNLTVRAVSSEVLNPKSFTEPRGGVRNCRDGRGQLRVIFLNCHKHRKSLRIDLTTSDMRTNKGRPRTLPCSGGGFHR
ncbi:ubiquinone/menaquinone biosynthesis C-methylase UbiE [Bradyrhizobium japonicum]|nr:ubiquinone/menaquinone biosynthesis C-methylase UbiE [Bradyrhizobium japonicum]MCP1962108.1 ubiquinone/menaquinone biosynthesis C-methylase UbiE [Bradyrhizobium japonicum]